MMNTKTTAIVRTAVIAALYTVVSLALAPFSFGTIQVRIAEALTMLPLLDKKTIPAVTLGCFLTNILGVALGVNPTGMIDAVVGTAATFLAAYGTWYFRDKQIHGIPVLSILMPVLLNFLFVGSELSFLFFDGNFWLGLLIMGAQVAAGECIAAVLGYILTRALRKTKLFDVQQSV